MKLRNIPGIRGDRTTIHRQLCICFFLAEVLFVFGLDATANPKVCGAIAGFLHYLFLASFAWMFVEAIHVYLMLVKVSYKMGLIRIWSQLSSQMIYSRESLYFSGVWHRQINDVEVLRHWLRSSGFRCFYQRSSVWDHQYSWLWQWKEVSIVRLKAIHIYQPLFVDVWGQ